MFYNTRDGGKFSTMRRWDGALVDVDGVTMVVVSSVQYDTELFGPGWSHQVRPATATEIAANESLTEADSRAALDRWLDALP